MQDIRYMRAALREALKGYGYTSPNPTVGCVIVRQGRIIARGWHRKAGGPHAEIEALNALPDPILAKGATLYVTLEPCCTHGRTPPCTEAILAAGIRRVVVGVVDPHPAHAGIGLERLRAGGVEVETGVLREACAHLNRAFFKWITTGLPWVIAKAGLSLDGRITRPPGEGQWLTGRAAREDAHRLRAVTDAVLIGAGTLRADDPSLTVREVTMPEHKAQPWRVVLSRGGGLLPLDSKVFTDIHKDRTLVHINKPLTDVLHEIGNTYQVTSVLAEGGGEILGALFEANLVDEVCFYMAPLLCGG
ncbi:MAG: bifunctional diaminohydroxyphosphoribosylaminopyrimidine deaminase/5-amino-6-(5-phosphoribosylamino)uracil reductase RibD, partial [Chthoniobacteraceae bacterium]|nr:bifunctional diaminohydroxyphosphoribosylaminopyrimidine deaminase/5-amino-6-(5-phosphoribosylamino)uracil reductase RibD [Chthoniobacteraceae bacterium]